MRRRLLVFGIALAALFACYSAVTTFQTKTKSYPVVVNHDQSLSEMIEAGNYYKVEDLLINREYFPQDSTVKGKRSLEAQIVSYRKELYADEVVEDLESKGLRPATLEELLAFGARFPEEHRKYGPIIALGSKLYFDGDALVPFLWANAQRGVGLRVFVRYPFPPYGPDTNFLAIKK